jgi:dsDNA-specific endonuclease/ATPase MutS2
LLPLLLLLLRPGPNTGGKTAALKALGLAAVAARCGLPVPAAAPARLPCFDAVLADIGDEQSLSASLSTFSGHLRRISALRLESGSRSLVLLDEVGTGGFRVLSASSIQPGASWHRRHA